MSIVAKLSNPPLYTGAAAVYPYSKALEQHFIVPPKYAEDELVFLARKSGDKLLVPRELAPLWEDKRSKGFPITLNMKVPPRSEDQKKIIVQSTALLKSGRGHIIEAKVGWGKSYAGVSIIVGVQRTALIIVTKEDLMLQWKQNLLKYTDIKEDEIGIVQQNRCEYGDGIKVAIAMVHSLASCEYPSDFYDWAHTVIIDECITGDADISLADGTVIKLEDLVTGFNSGLRYSVLSYNTKSNSFEPKQVTRVWRKGVKPLLKLSLDDGSVLRCTEDHLLYTSNRGWVAAKDLTISDDIITTNKPKSKLLKIEPCGEGEVFDIEVEDTHNFVANGVVVHNCHRVAANWFITCMFKLNSYARCGLSATLNRADGKSYVFHSHLGDLILKAKNHIAPPKVLVIKSGWRIPKWKKRLPYGGYEEITIPHKPGRMASVIKAMGMDDERNHLIADLCLKAYQKDRKIVIFFEQIDNHLKKLKPILVRLGIPARDISEYIGGLTENQRIENAKARVILGSYSYFSEGTDIPTLDTAILASPRSNVMQAIGRILRVMEGKKEPVIFDIVDEYSEALVNMHHSRMRNYVELKANVIRY